MNGETFEIVLYLFVLFLLLGGGVWVGLALLAVGLTGMQLFTIRPAGDAMATTIWSALSSWPLVALPLFIWMGEILTRSRVSAQLFNGSRQALAQTMIEHLAGAVRAQAKLALPAS